MKTFQLTWLYSAEQSMLYRDLKANLLYSVVFVTGALLPANMMLEDLGYSCNMSIHIFITNSLKTSS